MACAKVYTSGGAAVLKLSFYMGIRIVYVTLMCVCVFVRVLTIAVRAETHAFHHLLVETWYCQSC